MTKKRDFKKVVRVRMRRTGERYAIARANMIGDKSTEKFVAAGKMTCVDCQRSYSIESCPEAARRGAYAKGMDRYCIDCWLGAGPNARVFQSDLVDEGKRCVECGRRYAVDPDGPHGTYADGADTHCVDCWIGLGPNRLPPEWCWCEECGRRYNICWYSDLDSYGCSDSVEKSCLDCSLGVGPNIFPDMPRCHTVGGHMTVEPSRS